MDNKNILSLPFDPVAWANLENQETHNHLLSSALIHSSKPAMTAGNNQLETQVSDLISTIVSRGIDLTQGYTNWLNLGFALAQGLGENGRSAYHDLSRMNSEYNPQECDKQYNACLNSHSDGITINTLFFMAKEAGIDLSQFAREHLDQTARSATSANPPSANNSKNDEKSTISGVLDSDLANGGLAEVAGNATTSGDGYTFSDKLKVEDQSSLIRTAFELHGKEHAKCDAQLLGILNVAGGLMGGANFVGEERSGIYGIYDGRRVYAPHYNIVYSGAGNDKGNLIFCKQLLFPIKCEMRQDYEAKKKNYEESLVEWEATPKKERGTLPKEPEFRDPFLPGNSSSSAVYRATDANGGWGVMFETEADTISNMIDSDYGNYSDLMRKAHHHEAISMNRVTEKVHIDIQEPRLSIFLTCTPGQLPSLFPSFENGLGSRFLFYHIPDEDVYFHDVFALKDKPLEDSYRKLGEDLLPLYHALQQRAGHPIQFVMSQSQQHEFLEIYGGILQEQFKMLGKGIRAFIFRIALECFRYAMILTTLRRLSDWHDTFSASNPDQPSIFREDENALVCDDRDFRTAMTIIGCLINHTARVYAVMEKEDDNPFAIKGIKMEPNEWKVFRALPVGNFRTEDFLRIAAGEKISERSAQRLLSKMCNKFRIINPVKRGVYNKPEAKE